ncbi:MAG: recombination mediator RecR [Candidatus Omnitrophota bacterium]
MRGYSDRMTELVEALMKLPGIGRRSAERVLFHFLRSPQEEVAHLARLIGEVKTSTGFCRICHHLTDQETCHICRDPGRDAGVICVVEDPKDVIAIEQTGNYVGTYHVLLGTLSPLERIGPAEIEIQSLLDRLKKTSVREVILATNPNTEGEATALYIARLLKPFGAKISRLAYGISVGSMLEYTDQATLTRALEGRVPV